MVSVNSSGRFFLFMLIWLKDTGIMLFMPDIEGLYNDLLAL